MGGKIDVPVGIIEGFFGRPWRWADRAAYAGFLREVGFDFYIYAPKDDRRLRQQWGQRWDESTATQVAALAASYRDKGVRFGIGLSPFELHLSDPLHSRTALQTKAREINQVNPDILCILFDDMRGDMPELAGRQARIVGDICAASTARRFIVCPTYYSTDPLLDKVFGAMPENYLSDLGRMLDPAIDIFWTGPQVCSRRYPFDHLDEIADLLGRKPFLWDNYPVNDSAAMAPFLHIGPFRDRPAALQTHIAGHAVNPMNQPALSQIPLRTLADSYRQGDRYVPAQSFVSACDSIAGEKIGKLLQADFALLQQSGLENLADGQREALERRYTRYRGRPTADELLDWLAGGYAFDPLCLT